MEWHSPVSQGRLLFRFLPRWTPIHFSSGCPVLFLLEGGGGKEALMEEKYKGKSENELYFSLSTGTSLVRLSAKPFLGWHKVSTSLQWMFQWASNILKFERAIFSWLFFVFECQALSLHWLMCSFRLRLHFSICSSIQTLNSYPEISHTAWCSGAPTSSGVGRWCGRNKK